MNILFFFPYVHRDVLMKQTQTSKRFNVSTRDKQVQIKLTCTVHLHVYNVHVDAFSCSKLEKKHVHLYSDPLTHSETQ